MSSSGRVAEDGNPGPKVQCRHQQYLRGRSGPAHLGSGDDLGQVGGVT